MTTPLLQKVEVKQNNKKPRCTKTLHFYGTECSPKHYFSSGSDLRSREQHPHRRDVLPDEHAGQAAAQDLRADPRRHEGRVDPAQGRAHPDQDGRHLQGWSPDGLH